MLDEIASIAHLFDWGWKNKHLNNKNSLDAGIQDSSTSISLVVKVEKRLLKEMVMKVTNIYKHEIVDTHA